VIAVSIAGEACTIVAEVLLVLATWHHVHMIKFGNEAQVNTPIATVLLRDGTVYFIAILNLLILETILNVTSVDGAFVASITYALQAVLLTHFYLNLHEATLVTIPSNASQISNLHFTNVVGCLAGSLSYGTHSLPEDPIDALTSNLDLDEELAGVQDMDSHEQLEITRDGNGGSKAYALSSRGMHSVEEVPRVVFVGA